MLECTNLPPDAQERACWLRHTRERSRPDPRSPTSVNFATLREGHRLRSPFKLDFAVRGMGVAPAGKPLPGTGHHHLLIDTRLPMGVSDSLPFSDSHRHFGKGQTSAVLDLAPGEHRLRLLFANHLHVPYLVFSPEINIVVTAKRSAMPPRIDPRRFDASCAAWYQDELSRPRPPGDWLGLANLRDDEPVLSPVNLQLGVQGYGVCAVGQSAERSGYFILQVLGNGRAAQTLNLSNGATQAALQLPVGEHQLRLRFVDSLTERDLMAPVEHSLPVVGQERM